MKIIINGAGIAGPTLAYWLRQSGHQVLLVEQAPELRRGGYIIDFWGLGYDIAEKMGLLPAIRELGYQVREMRSVDRRGRKAGSVSTDVFHRMTGGRYTSLARSDLAATIFGALDDEVETIFGDSVAAIEEQSDCVRVSFDHAEPRTADLVIGADGLHSGVRELVFGPQEQFEVPLGYYVAAFEAKGYRPRDELVYVSHGIPGRQVFRFSMRDEGTFFLFVFREESLPGEPPTSEEAYKHAVRSAYADAGWECPAILEAMKEAEGVYFDRVSQIRMDDWTSGRTALLGDAAACVSLLAGEGSGLAMAEAYVLAGELATAGGNYARAFENYQERMMPFLHEKQEAAARFASSFAPKSALGIQFRHWVMRLLRIPVVADYFIGRDLRDRISLPEYAFSEGRAGRSSISS